MIESLNFFLFEHHNFMFLLLKDDVPLLCQSATPAHFNIYKIYISYVPFNNNLHYNKMPSDNLGSVY